MIVIPAVLFCVAGLFVASAAALAINQRPLFSVGVAAVIIALLSGLVALPEGTQLALPGILLDFTQPFNVLGRALAFSEISRPATAALLTASALLLAFAWNTPQGKYFVPLGVALTFFLFVALTARPFAYAALAFQATAVVGALLIQGDRAGPRSTLSSWRYLVSATLALAALFFAGWLADRAARVAVTDLTDAAVAYEVPIALMLISFVLLLGAVPLYSWIHPAVKDAPPMAAALLGAVALGATQLWVLDVWRELDWLRGDTARSVLSTVGSLLLVIAAVLAWAQRSFVRVLAAALFAEAGAGLLLVVLNSDRTDDALLLAVLVRSISLGAFCLGLAVLNDPPGRTPNPDTRLRLWALGAVVLGGMSLAGAPGTVGFVSRWVAIRTVSQTDLESLLLILAASASIGIGVLRSAYQILVADTAEVRVQADAKPPPSDNLAVRITLAVSMALVVLFGLWPSLLTPLLRAGTP